MSRSEPVGWDNGSRLERIWFGRRRADIAARAVLAPLSLLFRSAVAVRNTLYHAGILPQYEPALPAVSVGNLSVGGTGKTPVAAWLAKELVARGATPAIVLRGYGKDEELVHSRLNPGMPVIARADRLAGIVVAAARGANVVVLDDAFQHRRVRRVADIVLVSADRWTTVRRAIPSGPWRESLSSLGRATLVMVVRKAVGTDVAAGVRSVLERIAPGVPMSLAWLTARELNQLGAGVSRPLADLSGAAVCAISAIGDPRSFVRQLESTGALVRPASFPDHFSFDAASAARVARGLLPGELAVCTLKDAVKLEWLWPREAPPLWYVSQDLIVEQGSDALHAVLDSILSARPADSKGAGLAPAH